jgi:hypothetical protein
MIYGQCSYGLKACFYHVLNPVLIMPVLRDTWGYVVWFTFHHPTNFSSVLMGNALCKRFWKLWIFPIHRHAQKIYFFHTIAGRWLWDETHWQSWLTHVQCCYCTVLSLNTRRWKWCFLKWEMWTHFREGGGPLHPFTFVNWRFEKL